MLSICCLSTGWGQTTRYWDGGNGSDNWDDATNWYPDGVPSIGDSVVLDNSRKSGSYQVTLGPATSTQIRRLRITPAGNQPFPTSPITTITLIIPNTNGQEKALWVGKSPGYTDNTDKPDVTIDNGGIILNSSKVTTGALPFEVTGLDGGAGIDNTYGICRIKNGGRYIHNTLAGYLSLTNENDGLLENLVDEDGNLPLQAREGVFEFRMPNNASCSLDLSEVEVSYGKIPTLELSRGAASGKLVYTTNSSPLPMSLLGSLIINSNVEFRPVYNSTFSIAGNVTVNGRWQPNPTGGSSFSAINFNGNSSRPQLVSGTGTIVFQDGKGTNLYINNTQGGVVISTDMTLNVGSVTGVNGSGLLTITPNARLTFSGQSRITGNGSVLAESGYDQNGGGAGAKTYNGIAGAFLATAHPDGVNGSLALTGTRLFIQGVKYVFNGTIAQSTGLPTSDFGNPNAIIIANPVGVTLDQHVTLNAKKDSVSRLIVQPNALLVTGLKTINAVDALATATFGTKSTLSTDNTYGVNGALNFTGTKTFSATNDNNFIIKGVGMPTNGMPAIVNNLTIASAGTVSLSQGTTVNGALTMISGSLAIGANTLGLNGIVTTIGGTLTGSAASSLTVGNTATTGGALGTLVFTAGSQLLQDFTLNRTNAGAVKGSVTLGSPLSVNTLTLTKGLLNTTAANVVSIPASGSIAGGSTSSFVNGPIARETNSTAAYLLPTGKNSSYAPTGVIPSSSSLNTFTAEYFDSNPAEASPTGYSSTAMDGYLTQVSSIEYWRMNSLNPATAKVTLAWGAHSGVTNPGSLTVVNWNGSVWADTYASTSAGGVGMAGSGTISSDFVNMSNANGLFTLGSYAMNPLPVTFLTLTGRSENGIARLSWSTTSEENNEGFYVEKSFDAKSFERVGFVAANKKQQSGNAYVFADSEFTKSSYYRLQQVDRNGKSTFGKIIFVSSATLKPFVYPNPTEGHVLLHFDDADAEVSFQVFSADGMLIYGSQDSPQSVQVNFGDKLQAIPPGLYLIFATQLGQRYQTRLVKR